MNQNVGLIKFGQSILWSMAMLKREITFIVTMVNRMFVFLFDCYITPENAPTIPSRRLLMPLNSF